ncbi:MAG: hypothetical protein ACP5KG_05825 [Myxococcota bacterium]
MYLLKKAIFISIIPGLLAFVINCVEKSGEITTDVKTIKDSGKITTCKEGMMCKEDSDCFDGICSQGICRCKTIFCQKDDDCGNNMCCSVLNGSCYECIKDISFIDSIEEIISDIEVSDEDITDITTIFMCKKDLDCPLNIPHCKPKEGICVECLEDSHCIAGGCDINNGRCILPDAGDDVTDISGDIFGDIYIDVGLDSGSDILPDISNPCDNYICLCGSICVVNSGNPECVAGCYRDTDCCANTVCKSGKCEKTTCSDDTDCKDSSKPHCDVISGICYECTNDLHCSTDYYCDVSNHICKYKIDECYGQCKPNTQWCNPVKKQCEDIPSNWCAACSQIVDPVCIVSGLTCGITTKRCTKQCDDDSECFGYTCNPFGWCTCP